MSVLLQRCLNLSVITFTLSKFVLFLSYDLALHEKENK